jgi:uncharacterized protein YfaS (alpha-2-macroglobulin family)
LNELSARCSGLKPAAGTTTEGWRYSPVRQDAFSLLAVLACDKNHKAADEFSGQLLAGLKDNGYWNSTADTGMALFALSEYFKARRPEGTGEAGFKLITSAGEKPMNTGKFGIAAELSPEEIMNSNGIKIVGNGKEMINWSLEYSFPDIASRSESVDKGFSIEKTFVNMNGNKEFRVGDIIKGTLEFEDHFNKAGTYAVLSHIALEDPIPAGFTAINSALKNDSLPPEADKQDEEYYCDWTNGAYSFYPDHREFRNDRLLAFKNRAWSGRFRLVYYLRAICEGTFIMKPSQISLMYNPEIIGMTVPQTITVQPAQ